MAPAQRVVITGRIDMTSAASTRTVLHDAIAAGCGLLVVDLTDAVIGDSAGLGVLLGAYDRARRAGRELIVDGMSPRVARLLRVSRLERLLVPACRDARRHTVSAVTA